MYTADNFAVNVPMLEVWLIVRGFLHPFLSTDTGNSSLHFQKH